MPQSLIYVKEGIQSKGSNNNIRVGKAILYSGMNRENSSNNNLVNLTLSKDAIWQLPRATKANEAHYLGDLTLEAGSKVLLNPENEFHTFNQLNIQKLSAGNGYFRFNTDLASLIGNKVIIQEAQGEHMISVQDSGKEPSSINEQSFEFFKVSGNNTASFKLENGHIDAGAFRYKMTDLLSPRIKLAELKRIDKSFEEKQQAKRIRALTEEDKHAAESFIIETPLFKVKGLSHVIEKSFKKEISKYTNTAMSEFSAALHNLAEVNSSIHQHLVQENLTGKSFNVWSAVKTLNADYHSMYHRDYRKTGSQQQFGVDFSANHNLSFGTMLTHSQENNRFADVSSSRGRLTMFSVYAKHQLMDSLSIAMDLGMGQLSNQIVQDEQSVAVKHNVKQLGATLAKTFAWDAAEVKTLAGARYSMFGKTNYVQNQAVVHLDSTRLLSYFSGLNLGYRWQANPSLVIKPVLGWYYMLHHTNAKLTVNDHPFNLQLGNQQQLEAGMNIGINNIRVELLAGVTKGEHLKQQRRFSAKLAISF